MTNAHIHACITYIQTDRLWNPRETLQFFVYIPGVIWTIQHLVDTLVLNITDHVIHRICKFYSSEGNQPAVALLKMCELNSRVVRVFFITDLGTRTSSFSATGVEYNLRYFEIF